MCYHKRWVVREDLDRNGRGPYPEWFDGLNPQAAAKVAIAVTRIGQGKFSNVRSVGSGVHECKIKFGPGYRVFFGENGESLVILLGGETKKRQQGHQRRYRDVAGLQDQKEVRRISNGSDPRLQRDNSSASPP
jgi:putative addiction module killer protein